MNKTLERIELERREWRVDMEKAKAAAAVAPGEGENSAPPGLGTGSGSSKKSGMEQGSVALVNTLDQGLRRLHIWLLVSNDRHDS